MKAASAPKTTGAVWVAFAAVVLAAPTARADDTVALEVQAVLVRKILPHNRTVAGRSEWRIVVVDPDGGERARALAQAFNAIGLRASVVAPKDVAASLEGASVLYLFAPSRTLQDLALEKRVLSISGSSHFGAATADAVSIQLLPRPEGRPEIVVNLARMKAEGQDISSDLLALARVVR